MKTLTFKKMGGDISDSDYIGDIGNHRVRTEFTNEAGVRFFVEVCSTGIKRRTSKIDGSPLKKIIDVSSVNGMHIDIMTLYQKPVKSCAGTYFMHETEETIYEHVYDERPSHMQQRVLTLVSNYTGEHFDAIEII